MGFEKLAIGNQLEFARRLRWCSWRVLSADEDLPRSEVTEDSLDHILLSTFNESNDLQRIATLGTFQWIDFIDSLEQPPPKLPIRCLESLSPKQ